MNERTRLIVGQGDVRVDLIAEGAGTPIVLLPSSTRDSEDFDAFAERLAAAGFRVLRPQPRGMLGSTGPLEGISLHDLAADVALTIEADGCGPVLAAGHAFGNYVARMLAADRPDLVRGVVLLAAAAKSYAPELAEAVRISGDTSAPEADRLAALQFGFFAPGHDPRPWLANWHPPMHAVQRAATAAVPRDVWWPAGKAPILEVQAALDPFKPREKWAELRAEFGDRVQTVQIADASHALIAEQPDAVVAAIRGWADRLPG
jgi:pimeloyl-ACP methyl ester carboxylesterase